MRPRLHLTAETGWVNDPHGVTFHDGRYHLFHQYVPDSLVWAPHCHWGHATSSDLLTWDHHDVALAPGDGDDGIWTGSLVCDDDDARILYTSVSQPDLGLGRVRLAHPADAAWEKWTKGDVVVRPPQDLDLIAFRDPFVRREDAGWRMFVGASTRDGEALALTYTSADLTTWAYDGVAAARSTHETEPVWMGSLWECPQVLEVDGHWVMVSSVWHDDVLHYAGYGIGGADSYRHGRFTPSTWGRLSFGASYYAPSFFRDLDDRPCLLFWMRGVTDPEQGWAGCLSLPYLLSVRDGRLVATPHPAVTSARGAVVDAGTTAAAFDVEWTPAPTGDHLVLTAEAGTTARVSAAAARISLDRPGQETWSMPWDGGPVRVLVDGPVVEVSADGGVLGGPVEPTSGWQRPAGRSRAWELVSRRSARTAR